jgi:NAD(P)-dependent dehydrogenase (short-subunit alcohol dehydrogenase family)
MAIELGDRGIRVNALRLGWIQVERDRVAPESREYELFSARVPLGRAGEVEDVVPVAVFLSSEEASYVTGQVWGVDGGHEAVLSTAFPRGHVDGGARA